MAIKYFKIFQFKTVQNLPQIEIFGFKTNNLATLLQTVSRAFCVTRLFEKVAQNVAQLIF
jgi:hypothetical protein